MSRRHLAASSLGGSGDREPSTKGKPPAVGSAGSAGAKVPRNKYSDTLLVLFFLAGPWAAASELPFPARGAHNGSVHRFFPDLDARFNAVRYGRWRALEIAWTSGIDRVLDQRFSSYLLALMARPPRFGPEAERVAPRFLREAPAVFRAISWGHVLEQQLVDVLASPDASPERTRERLEKALGLHRRERWALSEPQNPAAPAEAAKRAPVSARILISGTRLFAVAAEDLAVSDFGQQRWKVKKTVEEFDRSYAAERPPAESAYRASAPTVASDYTSVAEHLDRLARFRAEVFEALIPGGASPEARQLRNQRIIEVARRYGLPVEEIGD